jgi:hypothetical protein
MDAPESEVLFRSKRKLEQSGRVHIDKPESGHVSFHSRMEQSGIVNQCAPESGDVVFRSREVQQVQIQWRSELVDYKQWRCVIVGVGGCTSLEQSGGVSQCTPESGGIYISDQVRAEWMSEPVCTRQ